MTQTTSENKSLPATIETTLRGLIRRARLAIIVRGVLLTLAAAILGMLASMGIAVSWLPAEPWQHYALTFLWLGAAAVAAFVWLVRPLAKSFSLAGIARVIEQRHPELQERLSSTVELLGSADSPEIRGSQTLIDALAAEAVGDARTVRPKREITFRKVRPPLYVLGGAVAVIVVLLAVVLLNTQFYLFLAAKRGRSFALAAIPFHLLYHFYNGLSFVAGTIRYFWKTGRFFSSRKVKSPRGASGAGRAKGAHG